MLSRTLVLCSVFQGMSACVSLGFVCVSRQVTLLLIEFVVQSTLRLSKYVNKYSTFLNITQSRWGLAWSNFIDLVVLSYGF